MKAITLTQPWATLVAIGAKTIETRSWATSHRGPLAIHAAAGLGPIGGKREFRRLISRPEFVAALPDHLSLYDFPFGAIVAVASLEDVILTEQAVERFQLAGTPERAFGNFAAGRYAWVLRGAEQLAEPLRCTGRQRLWNVDLRIGS